MYFLQQQQQKKGVIFIKLLTGVDVTMFQKVYKIINVIKICHFMRWHLMDFIFVCHYPFLLLLSSRICSDSNLCLRERQTSVTVLQSELFTVLG